MSEEELYEEELEAEEEEGGLYEVEEEEVRKGEELPLGELERMTDILGLMRKAVRGEIGEEDYRRIVSELLSTKPPAPAGTKVRQKKERGRKGVARSKKAA